MVKRRKTTARFTVCALLAAVMVVCACGALKISAYAEDSTALYFNKIAGFDTGNTNADGGTAEIVHYNSDNGKMYLVNGADQSIDIISLEAYESGAKTVFDENTDRIYINEIVENNSDSFAEGFEVGDIASVAVNTDLDVVAVAVQHSDYAANGAVVLLDYSGNFVAAYGAGVQPDNVVFGGNYILTADEGEPREGYSAGTDPKGSVTIVSGLTADNLTGGTSVQVYFDKYDSQRDSLTENGVIIMKGANPSTDFEPEYIVTNGTYAYVALQEANAIAILDIKGGDFTAICPLGFKDHSEEGNGLDLINDGKINIAAQDVYGVYMPDGMDLYTAEDGTTYLITANEGDAREWGEFSGVTKKAFTDENGENSTKVEVLDNTLWDGLDSEKTYVLGGRSFSVFRVTGTGIEMVYDSGDKIEQTIAASGYAAYFNCNSDDVSLDARSKKKGPEPEDVTAYEYNGQVCVSVCMERQSGFVTFDISDIVAGQSVAEDVDAASLGYTTTRDFTADMAGDVAPENLEYVAAADNATGKDLIVMANENSGTVSVYAIEDSAQTYDIVCDYTKAEESTPQTASALITAVYGTGDNTDGAFNYSFITIYNNTDSDLDLSGWAIQYKSGANSIDWQSFTLEAVLNAGGTYTVACAGADGTYSNSAALTEANYDAVWADLAYLDNKDLSVKITDAEGNTVDALGIYDKTNSEEGEGTLLSGTSKNKVITRNIDSGTGEYVDTDNNSADFTISGKITTADGAASYTPAANSSAKATAKVTINAENATVSGIEYLASGYVLTGEVSFTVTADTCYLVTAVTIDDTTLEAVEGAYSFTLTADCEINVITQVNHTVVIDGAVEPTCSSNGLTEGSHCSVCGTVFVEQAEIAKLEHTYNEDGICTVCGENVLTFELNEDGTYTVTGINDAAFTKVIIPSAYNGQAVTSIAAGAFKNNKAVTYLYIPASITSIGNNAFYGCSALTEIYYNAASVSLAASNYVFCQAGQGGDGIAVTIGKDVTVIPAYLFNPYGVSASYAPNLVSVTFEEGSTCQSVGDRAFAFCNSLTTITFPDSVTTLGTYMFYGCSALESVTFGSGMATIGSRAFYSCTSLKSVTFANTIGWFKGQTTTLSNNGYAVNLDVTDSALNAENFLDGWGAYTFIRTDNVIFYYVDGVLYGAACYSTSITAKQLTNLKSAISVTTVPSKQCYKGSWDASITYKMLQSGGLVTVNAVYTLNHTLTHCEAAGATCTENGNTEYWYCTVCEKYFSDEGGTTEISAEDTIVSATGHSYTLTGWEWSGVDSATASFTCVNDENTEVVTATITSEVTTQPSCTEEGATTYTAAVIFEGQTYTDTKTVAIEAAGHSYTSVVTEPTCTEQGYTTYTCNVCGDSYTDGYTEATGHEYTVTSIDWAEDYSSATATLTCENDSTHMLDVTAVITSEVTKEVTAVEDGEITYTATVTIGGQTYTYAKTVTVPATGDSGTEDSSETDSSTADSSTQDSSTQDSSTQDSSAQDSSAQDSAETDSSTEDSSKKTGSGCGAVYTGGDGGINGDMGLVLCAMALVMAAVIAVRAIKKRH